MSLSHTEGSFHWKRTKRKVFAFQKCKCVLTTRIPNTKKTTASCCTFLISLLFMRDHPWGASHTRSASVCRATKPCPCPWVVFKIPLNSTVHFFGSLLDEPILEVCKGQTSSESSYILTPCFAGMVAMRHPPWLVSSVPVRGLQSWYPIATVFGCDSALMPVSHDVDSLPIGMAHSLVSGYTFLNRVCSFRQV